jgi:hypothetical protein
MIAAPRLLSECPVNRFAQAGAPPASASAREIAPGVVRLEVPASQKTPDGLASLADILVQVGEVSVLGRDVVIGQDYSDAEVGPDAIDGVFVEEPARLAWLGKLICLLTATSTSATIVWALVG